MKRERHICCVVILAMFSLGDLASAQTERWINIGPAPIQGSFVGGPASGRVASIAVDPTDSNHWLVGASDGGVWATFNAGLSWTPLTDDQPSLAMGAVAFAPSSPNIVYAGTGDRFLLVGAYVGAGLLKSTDGGLTWTLLAAATFAGTSFSHILVDPAKPTTVLATTTQGSVGLDPTLRPPSVPPRGIFKSTDGGLTWSQNGPKTGDGAALVANPANFSQMFAGLGVPFSASTNGVYRSTDTGDTWTLMSGPWSSLPAGIGLVALAIAPSNPNVLYVAIQDAYNGVGNDAGLLGLWRTDNAWAITPTWTQIPTGATDGTLPGFGYCGNRCGDLLDIIVDPTDPSVLYASGVTFWKCTNCSANPTWTDVRRGIHIDQRTEAWAGNRLIVGNDGGVYSTTDGGMNWTSHNTNLSITQFNGGCLHPTDPNIVIGGSQDNGYERTTGLTAWQSLPAVGDGGRCAFSSSAPNTNWALSFLRTLDGGASVQDASAGIDFHQAQVPLFFPFEKCPAKDDVFIAGNSTLWRIDNYFRGTNPSWSANSPRLEEPISGLAFAPQDKTCNTYAYGTQFGTHLRLTSDGGAQWVELNAGSAVPHRYVTALAFDPTNSNILYVTLSGFDESTPNTPGHVFKTMNALSGSPSWSNVSPPANLPHNTIAVDGSDTNLVYVGTDLGVWRSTNAAATWTRMGPASGMPNVAVYDLKINDATKKVVAFTHGRGALAMAIQPMVNALPAQLNFAAKVGQGNPQSQNVALSVNQAGAFAWTAAASTNGGGPWLALLPATGTFPATASVSVNISGLTEGTYNGAITITVPNTGNSPLTISVVLLIAAAPPAISPGGIVNAASFAPGALAAAGELVSIFGSNFGVATPLSASNLPLPTVMGGVKVIMGGIAAPLIFVSAGQINCQVPYELAGQGSVQVVVQSGTTSSPPATQALALAAPGVFTVTLNGRTQGAILNQDSALNTPANPAKPGDIVQIFATGPGPLTGGPKSGEAAPSSPPATTQTLPVVTIGGKPAQVSFSGLTPGLVGLWQINATVPTDVPISDVVTVQVQQGGATSNTTTLAVAQK